MPADNRSRCYQDKRLFPSRPQPSQRNPEQLVRRSQSPPRTVGVEGEQLLTQSQVFKEEVPACAKGTAKPAEEMPEPYNHGKDLIRQSPIEFIAISLILQVYEVLMNDTGTVDRTEWSDKEIPV